jgi:hypothetical protein
MEPGGRHPQQPIPWLLRVKQGALGVAWRLRVRRRALIHQCPLMERYERARTHVVVKEVTAFPVWLDRAPLHRVAGPVSLKLDQRGRVTELLTCTPIPRRM